MERYVFIWLLAVALGLGVGHSQVEPDPPLRLPGAVVRDANSTLVGELVGAGYVLIRDGSLPIVLGLSVDRLHGNAYVFYSDLDCEGTIYVQAAKNVGGAFASLIGYNYSIGKDSYLYRSMEAVEPQAIEVDSNWNKDTEACENETRTNLLLLPAIEVVRLDDLFVPPFYIE